MVHCGSPWARHSSPAAPQAARAPPAPSSGSLAAIDGLQLCRCRFNLFAERSRPICRTHHLPLLPPPLPPPAACNRCSSLFQLPLTRLQAQNYGRSTVAAHLRTHLLICNMAAGRAASQPASQPASLATSLLRACRRMLHSASRYMLLLCVECSSSGAAHAAAFPGFSQAAAAAAQRIGRVAPCSSCCCCCHSRRCCG